MIRLAHFNDRKWGNCNAMVVTAGGTAALLVKCNKMEVGSFNHLVHTTSISIPDGIKHAMTLTTTTTTTELDHLMHAMIPSNLGPFPSSAAWDKAVVISSNFKEWSTQSVSVRRIIKVDGWEDDGKTL